MDQVAIGQPSADAAGIGRLRAGENAHADRFNAALVPIKARQILGKAFGQTIVSIGLMRCIQPDGVGLQMHAHGMNGTGINHPLDALAIGRFPDRYRPD